MNPAKLDEDLLSRQCDTRTAKDRTARTQIVRELIHMSIPIILASASEIRSTLLSNAGIEHSVEKARVDEESMKLALIAEGATTRDVADALAEMKALKVASRNTEAIVIGCDQVLDFKGAIISKPKSHEEAIAQLTQMQGEEHRLLSAAVVFYQGEPVWRHVGVVRLKMDNSSDAYIADYVQRNWASIQWAVGAYKLEEEGLRLFTKIDGDYFNVLGLPMIELIAYLKRRGAISS